MEYYTKYNIGINFRQNDNNKCDGFLEQIIDWMRQDSDVKHVAVTRDGSFDTTARWVDVFDLDSYDRTMIYFNDEFKHWDWEYHMQRLSAAFPSFVFILEGDGEISEDMWKAKYFGGKFISAISLVWEKWPDSIE